MRVLLQRVSRAEVRVEGRSIGAIGAGFCLLVGYTGTDTEAGNVWMADKVAGLRLFGDTEGKMNLGLSDVGGEVLVVSQFTLYGDTNGGRRPSWIAAARPEHAEPLVQAVVDHLRALGATVATGRFRTEMLVDIQNDGPVTVLIDL